VAEDPQPKRAVPEIIEPYVQRFIAEGAARGYEITVDQLVVEFESPLGDQNHPSANCTNAAGLPAPIIKLDTTRNWWRLGDMAREEVIFHELGHCILGQSHRNELLDNGEPESLMRAESPLLYLFIELININLTYKRDYYLDELFGSEVGPPCWIQPDRPSQEDPLWIADLEFGFHSMLTDRQGEVWGADFSQLHRFNGTNRFEIVGGAPDFNTGRLNTVTLDNDDQLWITKENDGVTTIWKHVGEQQFEQIGDPLPLVGIRSMEFDGENNLWMTSARGQVAILGQSPGDLIIYDPNNSTLPVGFISDVVNVGICDMYFLVNGKLVRSSGTDQFETVDHTNSNLPLGSIQQIATDLEDRLWLVINKQLAMQASANEFEVVDMVELNFPIPQVNTMTFDQNGGLWLGTSLGLRHLKNGTRFTDYCQYFLGAGNNNVRTIAFDDDGNVWTGSNAIVRQRVGN
ncbi:MAG: two-component regulator propeller domain-containing protein, partial [Cyclobacteriaceae bacterium]